MIDKDVKRNLLPAFRSSFIHIIQIASAQGAFLMADIAHISGLVAAKVRPYGSSPFDFLSRILTPPLPINNYFL